MREWERGARRVREGKMSVGVREGEGMERE